MFFSTEADDYDFRRKEIVSKHLRVSEVGSSVDSPRMKV